jgi:signal transduction histidine kinase
VRTTTSLGTGATAILDENYRSVLAAQRMGEAIEALDRAALLHLTAMQPLDAATIEREAQRFESELTVEEGNFTESGEAAIAADLRQQWQRYRERIARLPTLDTVEARTLYASELGPGFLAVRAAAARLLDVNQDAMLRKSDRARTQAARTVSAMLIATLAALVIGLVLSSLLTRRLLPSGGRPARRGRSHRQRRLQRARRGGWQRRGRAARGDVQRHGRSHRSLPPQLARRAPAGAAGGAIGGRQPARRGAGLRCRGRGADRQPHAEELLDVGRAGITRAALDRLDAPLRAIIEEARSHVLSGRGAYVPRLFEDAVRRPSSGNGDLYYLARATPVYGEHGAVSGATVILQDVTRLHRFDQLKNDLVATVAHELRTPLTSLQMAIHLCLEEAAGPLTDRQTDLLQAGREECERLQRIVDELLDLAKLQGGHLQLRRRTVALRDVVDEALDAQRSVAAERRVPLAGEVAPGLPDVAVDEDRLHLVFANLLTNAIRHSPPGAPSPCAPPRPTARADRGARRRPRHRAPSGGR